MGSDADARFAAAVSDEDEAQRRVCEMRSVAWRGWPMVAMLGLWEVDMRSTEAVWRMWVCGMETVMTMRRGGWGEGGAQVVEGVDEVVLGRWIVLCSCMVLSAL